MGISFKALLLLSVFAAASPAMLYADGNYQSKVWNPDLGNGRYRNPVINADYSDPDVIRTGDDFWMTSSSFCNMPALPVLHSTDLVNWEIANYAVEKLPPFDFYSVPQHGKGVWAPSIRFHNGEYYIYWADPDFGIYMVKTDNPRGRWEEPVLVAPTKGVIDVCPLWDEDGKAWLVNAWAKSRSGFNSVVTVSELSADGTKLLSDPVIVYDGMPDGNHTVEGPKFYKRNGWYYIMAPAGGVEQGWQLAMRAKSPLGPYECRTVMKEGNSGINGPHQGGWVTATDGSDWFINFQDKGVEGRVVHLNPVEWKDGWPVVGVDMDGDGCGEPVASGRIPGSKVAKVKKNPAESDDFNSLSLGKQWQWFANYSPLFGMPTNYGYFRLYGHKKSAEFRNVREVPNLLTQKFPNDTFSATAKVTVSATADGQEAGLIIMGRDYARMSVEWVDGEFVLRQVECFGADEGNPEESVEIARLKPSRDNCEGLAATHDIDLYLRVDVKKDYICSFSFSTDGKKWKACGKPFKARQGHWIGARVGFFALAPAGKPSGWVDIDSFDIEK